MTNETRTLPKGAYCGEIDISGGANVKFEPGIYVLMGDGLKVSGNSTIIGNEVGFYLTSRNGREADINITAATVNLTAPESGPMKGLIFFQDRDARTTVRNKIAGNGQMRLEGGLYFMRTQLDFAGTSATDVPAPHRRPRAPICRHDLAYRQREAVPICRNASCARRVSAASAA